MAKVEEIVARMRKSQQGHRFTDVCKACDHYFGDPRQRGSSHRVYKMPWAGDPRDNLQNRGGLVKPYQVKQVLKAIERLEAKKWIKFMISTLIG